MNSRGCSDQMKTLFNALIQTRLDTEVAVMCGSQCHWESVKDRKYISRLGESVYMR